MSPRGCFLCLKYLVFVVNFLFLIFGLAVLLISTWLLVDEELYQKSAAAGGEPYLLHCILLGLATTVLLLSFLGCCGSIKESACLLALFFTLLLLLFIGEVVGALFLYFREDVYRSVLTYGLLQTVLHRYHANNTLLTTAWDSIQQQLECCGAVGPTDWSRSAYNGYQDTREIGIGGNMGKPFRLPPSCCRTNETALCSSLVEVGYKTIINLDKRIFYTQGCADKLEEIFRGHLLYILIFALCTVVVEIMGMIFSLCLCTAVKRIEQRKP